MKYLKISLLLGLIFVASTQPLVMIGILLSVVLFYAIGIYFYSMSFWFGYILMLILLSGVLVIFTYIVSLIPNESFEYFSLLMIFGTFFYLFVEMYNVSMDLQSVFSVLLWEGVISMFLIFMAIFLLSIMMMVIFLSHPEDGSLR